MKVPLVYMAAIIGYSGGGFSHSRAPIGNVWHGPGLKLVIPTTPYDAKGLLKTAIRDDNPVISFEHMALGGTKGEVPEEEYTIPFGKADIKKKGSDVTVVALSKMVQEVLKVAEELEKEGISLEVIDPRTLVPMDTDTIRNSVAKT